MKSSIKSPEMLAAERTALINDFKNQGLVAIWRETGMSDVEIEKIIRTRVREAAKNAPTDKIKVAYNAETGEITLTIKLDKADRHDSPKMDILFYQGWTNTEAQFEGKPLQVQLGVGLKQLSIVTGKQIGRAHV